MSEKDTRREQEILLSAKKIMNDFFEKLSTENVENETFGLERETQTRKPAQKEKTPEFKDKILANAPSKNQDYILAEKKSW